MVSDIQIFDRARRRLNRKRSLSKLGAYDFLIQKTQDALLDRRADIKRDLPTALQIGGIAPDKNFIHMDMQSGNILGDEEFLPFAGQSFDLILSPLTLHSVNDLPGALLQIKQTLKPDGVFLAALFGGETLYEMRETLMHAEMELKGGASPRVFPFADKQQMGALMQRAGFALPVVDSEIITVTYENIFKLMHDLRGMGEGNIILERSKTNPGKEFFMKAGQYYQDNFTDPDGRITASFEIIYLIGWAPHESQQQPLKPGSAQTRLADVLNSQEIKTGEKAIP